MPVRAVPAARLLQLIIGIPAILGAFGAVLWTKGFGPEDRELFRLRKDDVAGTARRREPREARDQVAGRLSLTSAGSGAFR